MSRRLASKRNQHQQRTKMNISKLSVLAGLVLGGLVACSSSAMAQDQKPGGKGGRGGFSVEQQMERLETELKLTDDQKPKVKAALEATAKKRQELRDSGTSREEMRDKMRAIMDDQDKKMKEILKPEQYTKYEEVRSQMRQGGKKKGEEKKN